MEGTADYEDEGRADMSTLQTGCCHYCGQVINLETDGKRTEAELDRMAQQKCSCTGAARARRIESTEQNIEELFAEKFPDVAELLKAAVPMIMQYELNKITIDTGKKVKAVLTMNAKGMIKVEKNYTAKASVES